MAKHKDNGRTAGSKRARAILAGQSVTIFVSKFCTAETFLENPEVDDEEFLLLTCHILVSIVGTRIFQT